MNKKTLLLSILAVLLIVASIVFIVEQISKTAKQPISKGRVNELLMPHPIQIVNVTKSGFDPATIRIKAGTVILWKNQSGEIVTVNSDPYPTNKKYPALNLGAFATGSSVQLLFSTPGVYTYHDQYHPGRGGNVVVE